MEENNKGGEEGRGGEGRGGEGRGGEGGEGRGGRKGGREGKKTLMQAFHLFFSCDYTTDYVDCLNKTYQVAFRLSNRASLAPLK
jgi:hypothetical protein